MLGISDYPAFVLAILVFLAIPGPGNLALLVSTAKGGVRGGLASTLGIMAGEQGLIWLAVFGVSVLVRDWPGAVSCCRLFTPCRSRVVKGESVVGVSQITKTYYNDPSPSKTQR